MDILAITLRDGRLLAYGDYGDPNGTPLIHCHGSNSSRRERPFAETILHEAGVRLIVPDRPGHGGSSPALGRTLLTWADDVAALANALGFEQFTVSGYSAGGPHAAAIAYRLPQRVCWLGLIASIAPLDRPNALDGVSLAGRIAVRLPQHAYWLLQKTAALQAKMVSNNIERTVKQFANTLPPQEQAFLRQAAPRAVLAETIQEAYRQGGAGAVEDSRVYTAPWGFSPSDISVPTTVWQGKLDKTAVPQMGRYLAETIPNAELRLLPEAGHLALYGIWNEVITAVAKNRPHKQSKI